MNTKGQVTLFVIIGIVLLIAVAIIFFLTRSTQELPEEELVPELTEIGEEYRPIDLYVKSCLTTIGTSVLEEIGQHGGYIRPLEELEYDITKPYDSDGVLLTSTEQSFVPYWSYIPTPTEEDITIYPTFNIPELEKIQETHSIEIDANIMNCINNFEDLNFTGATITIKEEGKSTVTYTQDSVIIQLQLPLTITTTDGATKEIEEFYSILDIPFKQYYDLANLIAAQEYENQYLENLIILLIGYYGKIDSTAIPPFYGIRQGYSYDLWVQTDVNQKLKALLLDNVGLLQVPGTNNTYDIESLGLDETDQAFYESLQIPLFFAQYPQIEVNHHYLNWPIYSKVWPTDGELIKPTPNNYDIPKFSNSQDQTYNFFYDIAYPVVVELREQDVFLGEDFIFMFALESNIRKNHDWRAYANGAGPIVSDPSDIIATPNQEEEQLDPITNETVNVPTSAKKLFTDPKQFISQPLLVHTTDYKTGLPLEDVNVEIGIGTYAKTRIGTTTLENGQASFQGSGPIVKNGYVALTKRGYLAESEFLTLDNSTTPYDLGTVSLLPLERKNVSMKVLEMVDVTIPDLLEIHEALNVVDNLTELDLFFNKLTLGSNYVSFDDEIIMSGHRYNLIVVQKIFERNINPSENIMLSVDYLPSGKSIATHSAFAQFSENITRATIELVPGRYTIDGMLFDNEGIIIPPYSKKICSGDACDEIPEEEQYIPKEPLEMKPAIWGGVEFNESIPWFISTENTYAENNITFYVLKFPQPKNIDDLSKLGELASYTSQKHSLLLPKIKTAIVEP